MTSEVDISNIALAYLGANQITSLDDDSNDAALCKLMYAGLRDTVLADREWTFAVARVQLPALAAAPDWGYTYQFQLPPDVLRVLNLSDDKTQPVPPYDLKWRREGSAVACNSATIYVRYLKRIEDPNKFSPHFVQALAARMAADLAWPITNSKETVEKMTQLYALKLQDAMAVDGMQGSSDVLRAKQLHSARYSGSSSVGPYV